jgi:amino acid transporter
VDEIGEVHDSGTGVPEVPSTVYARKATGFVREISLPSGIIMNMSYMTLAFLVLIATAAPSSFPGASPFWAVVIAAVLCVFPILLFGMFMAVMPRSGGDYVFISRTLHPWLGFAANFNFVAWLVLSLSCTAALIAPFAVSSAFSTIGVAGHSPTMRRWAVEVTSQNWTFALGAIAIIATALMVSLSMHQALRIWRVIFAVSILGLLIALAILVVNGRSDFVAAVSRFGGNYDKVLSDARSAGFPGSGGFDLKNTVWALPLAAGAFAFAIATPYAGGEMRMKEKNTGLYSMLLAVLIGAVLSALLMALSQRTFGTDFLGSATYLSNNGSGDYPFSSPAFFFFFVSMLTSSVPLIAIMGISFVVALTVVFPAIFVIASRSLFAWSFDRILPTQVAYVREGSGAPLVSNAIIFVGCMGFLVVVVYASSSLVALLFTSIIGSILTWIVLCIAGIVFPFRRRDLYLSSSPVTRNIGPIPVFSLISVAALAVYLLFLYPLLTKDALGANASTGMRTVWIVLIVSVVLYPISAAVNRSRGRDVSLASRTLPPD